MSDRFSTSVYESSGPIHNGSGDQIVRIYQERRSSDDRRHTPREIAEADLRWLRAHFVLPGGFDRAGRILDSLGTVLLDGPPGSGRQSAARMLLDSLPTDGRLHELVPDEEEKHPWLDTESIGDGDRLLLDLSDSSGSEAQWRAVHGELSTFRKALADRRAHLVVVLPHHRKEPIANELTELTVMLSRPPDIPVVQHYLQLDGVPSSETDEGTSQALHRFLSRRPSIERVARFAQLVIRAHQEAAPGDTFASWCEQAHQALTDWGDQVSDQLATLRRGPQRSLLLATAMLHEADGDTIHLAESTLLTAVSSPPDERPLLEHEDLAERLKEIGAQIDDSGQVHFAKLDYDTAIRAHIWRHRPDLRERWRTWVFRLIDRPEIGQYQDTVVERFSDLCLHTGQPELLIALVGELTARPSRDDRRPLAAAQLLTLGLADQHHGAVFRRRIYHWSKEPGLPPGLAGVLVAVCAQTMVVRHPNLAIVRLHHLARHERHSHDARDALIELCREDHRLLRTMLDRLAADLPKDRYPEDVDLFLALTGPERLTDCGSRSHALLAERVVYEQLVVCWSEIFRRAEPTRWQAHAAVWLRAANDEALYHDPLLDLLVASAERHLEAPGHLYNVAYRVERSTTPRRSGSSLTDDLVAKLDAAQGVRTAPRHPPTTRENPS